MYFVPDNELSFPHPLEADENGILGIGGDLSPERLYLAYQHGIFPWFNEEDPVLWWFPNPRAVLFPNKLKISKSMRSYFNQKKFHVTYDTKFSEVIFHCRNTIREGQGGTWITDEMEKAYIRLHQFGIAHSVEVWKEEVLVGGLYGIAIGKIFYGESMFVQQANASKFGFISLVRKLQNEGFVLIDCQQDTPHMQTLGSELISAEAFYDQCLENQKRPADLRKWR